MKTKIRYWNMTANELAELRASAGRRGLTIFVDPKFKNLSELPERFGTQMWADYLPVLINKRKNFVELVYPVINGGLHDNAKENRKALLKLTKNAMGKKLPIKP